jgi:3-dehydroquinate dehydratase-2
LFSSGHGPKNQQNKRQRLQADWIIMASLLLLNGPNLNLLGTRQPEIYGSTMLGDIVETLTQRAASHGYEIEAIQSNQEGIMVDALHAARGSHAGVLLNAAAYTHTSIALRDAISAIELPVIEIHLSNIHARETFRHHSMIAPMCIGQISGFGAQSYSLALDAMIAHLS